MQRLDESRTTSTARVRRAARRDAAPESRTSDHHDASDSDSLYRAYFENTSEGLFIIDVAPDGHFIFRELNPIHERLTGLPTASLRGRTPHQCLPQQIADEVDANYRRCVESGTTVHYEERLDLPGGTRDWQTSLTPVRDQSGRITRILGSSRDITDQKHKAEELEESRSLLQSVLSSITECYYTLDRDFNVTAINGAAAAWLGVAPEAVVGRSYWELLSPATPCGAVVMRAAADGSVVHREMQSSARPGRWLDYHVYPSQSGLSIFFRDITDEVAARKQVEDAAMLLQGTIDALPARVAVLDEFGVITAVNRAWTDLADIGGYRSECCRVGESYIDFCKKAGATARNAFLIARRLEQLLAGRVRQGRHLYYCDTGHGTRWYQMRASRFEVAGANRIVIAHEDVTDVRRADDARREAGTQLLHTLEEERRRIARELHDSTAQHLTAVGLQLSCLLRMGSRLGIDDFVEDARESLLEAQREIRTLSYLLHPPVTGAESLVSAARRFIEGFELRTGLNTTLRHVDDPLPPLSADRGAALFRVLQEALANVHKHAGATMVDVSLRHSRDTVALDVKDDGAGFDIVDWDPGSHAHIVFGVGIPGMRARMKQYEGDLTIRRARKGTLLRAWLTAGDIDHAA
jgi:PAS domain S-box-containing protein